MMSDAYYNENDPYAAEWLRNLIAGGHIAPGYVDERSISDILPDDLKGYTQCHFFAGIGIWSLALRRAGWPDERPVWTGSCPCQPFSAAGAGGGEADERHLWPHWFHLITSQERYPGVVFGEQVASPDGLGWFDLVSADMESAGYAIAATDTCAAGFGAPHIRQRLYFVSTQGLADVCRKGPQGWEGVQHCAAQVAAGPSGVACQLGHAASQRCAEARKAGSGPTHRAADAGATDRAVAPDSPWENADWLFCRDGKWRPVEPGTFPLAHGATSRVGRLRAYGNGLCLAQAQAHIGAFCAVEQDGFEPEAFSLKSEMAVAG